jgi:hypothetical protein
MALSVKTRKQLEVSMAHRARAKELADAVDAMHAIAPAADVAAIGTTSDLPTAALSTSDTYTDAAVNTAINALKTAAEARLDTIEAKIDAILAALKAASIML